METVKVLIDSNGEDYAASRLSAYAGKVLNSEMTLLEFLADNRIRELLKRGVKFWHKSLEEYVKESGKELIASPEFDWGEPKGRELL